MDLVVVVDTIQRRIVLIGARTCDAATSAIVRLVIVQAKVQNSRLQAQQVGYGSLYWYRLNGGCVQGIPHRCVRGIQGGRLPDHADVGRERFDGETEVERDRRIYQDDKILRLRLESGSLCRHGVLARRQLRELVPPVVVDGAHVMEAVSCVSYFYAALANHRAGAVPNSAAE